MLRLENVSRGVILREREALESLLRPLRKQRRQWKRRKHGHKELIDTINRIVVFETQIDAIDALLRIQCPMEEMG
jgi:hypothetical protein